MKINVESRIRGVIPDVVIDFLRGIVKKDDTLKTILLVPAKLSSTYIQEIICENEDGTNTRRAFGFDPVYAMLNVLHTNGEAVMRLIE